MILSTSERIKELREKNGYTQAALAAKLSVTRACVNAWEMGISSPSTENLVELTQIFHVTSDYILGISGSESIEIGQLKQDQKNVLYQLINLFSSEQNSSLLDIINPEKNLIKKALRNNFFCFLTAFCFIFSSVQGDP